MDIAQGKEFFEDFIEVDYQAQYWKYGEEAADEVLKRIIARKNLFSAKIKTRVAVGGGSVDMREKLVKRKIFALALHETKAFGTVCAGYLSGAHDFSVDTLDHVYVVAEVDGKPIIIQQQAVDTDGDASELCHKSGEDLGKLGKPTEVSVFGKPAHPGEAELLPDPVRAR